MRRRDCLRGFAATILSGLGAGKAFSGQEVPRLTPPEEIERRVRAARPLLGGQVPADLKRRLGATHYDGKYHLTKEPFLLEGCKALQRLGIRVAKLWFGQPRRDRPVCGQLAGTYWGEPGIPQECETGWRLKT